MINAQARTHARIHTPTRLCSFFVKKPTVALQLVISQCLSVDFIGQRRWILFSTPHNLHTNIIFILSVVVSGSRRRRWRWWNMNRLQHKWDVRKQRELFSAGWWWRWWWYNAVHDHFKCPSNCYCYTAIAFASFIKRRCVCVYLIPFRIIVWFIPFEIKY